MFLDLMQFPVAKNAHIREWYAEIHATLGKTAFCHIKYEKKVEKSDISIKWIQKIKGWWVENVC